MQNVPKLLYYFNKYAASLQKVTYKCTGYYYHKNDGTPVDLVYLCPLCMKNIIGIIDTSLHYDEEFSLDHYPPFSVGGKDTVLVCKRCNETAGKKFDYALKEWVQEQSFIKGFPGTKVPIKLQLADTKGKYKGKLTVDRSGGWSFDQFDQYPLVKKWFEQFFKEGKVKEQILTLSPPIREHVNKALLKAAYLYSFSIWGYDFAYSFTAKNLRAILFQDQPHPLSNWGIFFHMNEQQPPIGLSYVFKPKELQTFMINLELSSKDTPFFCSASILIPAPDQWNALRSYQPLIDEGGKFTNALIKLPEDFLTNQNVFPYSSTWNNRDHFKIAGEHS